MSKLIEKNVIMTISDVLAIVIVDKIADKMGLKE